MLPERLPSGHLTSLRQHGARFLARRFDKSGAQPREGGDDAHSEGNSDSDSQADSHADSDSVSDSQADSDGNSEAGGRGDSSGSQSARTASLRPACPFCT